MRDNYDCAVAESFIADERYHDCKDKQTIEAKHSNMTHKKVMPAPLLKPQKKTIHVFP